MKGLHTDPNAIEKSKKDGERNSNFPRPDDKAIQEANKDRRQLFEDLKKKQRHEGLTPIRRPAIANRKSSYETVEEERQARNEAASDCMMVLRNKLPVLLKRLRNIKDPRDPKKIKHKMTILMIYGILVFVFQMASRRDANDKMTRPMFLENLKLFFPELEDLPHSDTLARLLKKINVSEIEQAQIDLVHSLIKSKKFKKYLIDGSYPVSIDGSQKFARDSLWAESCSERNVRVKEGKEPKKQFYVYVLEASLTFYDGMTIPLMSEFADYVEGYTESEKQDCEQKAFKRLAKRIKKNFPRLKIMVLLDGLYANGPIIEVIKKYNWDGMIVLQSKSLSTVWEEFDGLIKLLPENIHCGKWGNRRQAFEWVNDIEYYYGDHDEHLLKLHMVVCHEIWEEVDKCKSRIEIKRSLNAWISIKPLNRGKLHERCNLGARHRWNIEHGFLVEKHHGYRYEHCFSYNWNAMKGFHYLMRIGHTINILVQFSECFAELVQESGVRGLIDFIRETISGPWLDPAWVKQRLAAPFQLRLR